MNSDLLGALIALGALIITNSVYAGWRFGRLEERVKAIDERGPQGLLPRVAVLEQKVNDIDERGCGALRDGWRHR